MHDENKSMKRRVSVAVFEYLTSLKRNGIIKRIAEVYENGMKSPREISEVIALEEGLIIEQSEMKTLLARVIYSKKKKVEKNAPKQAEENQ